MTSGGVFGTENSLAYIFPIPPASSFFPHLPGPQILSKTHPDPPTTVLDLLHRLLSLQHLAASPAVWWCSMVMVPILTAVLRACWETPRGRYDEHNSKFSLSKKPRFNRPVGEESRFRRCCCLTIGRAHYRRQKQRGTCTQHNQNTLPQRFSEVVNLTGFAETKD